MKDELYDEVKRYRDLYRGLSAEQILQIMGEMRDFFFNRMTRADFEKYEKLRAMLSERKSAN